MNKSEERISIVHLYPGSLHEKGFNTYFLQAMFSLIRRINDGVGKKNYDVNNFYFCNKAAVDSDSQVSYILTNLTLP